MFSAHLPLVDGAALAYYIVLTAIILEVMLHLAAQHVLIAAHFAQYRLVRTIVSQVGLKLVLCQLAGHLAVVWARNLFERAILSDVLLDCLHSQVCHVTAFVGAPEEDSVENVLQHNVYFADWAW